MTGKTLEARYRRLLVCYPRWHRMVHADEMTGVLLAGARPGQRRPTVGETVNLLAGAARIRLRPGRSLSDPDGWRDALAIFSVAAPVLAFASVMLALLVDQEAPVHSGVASWPVSLIVWGQALTLPFVVARRRKAAALASGTVGAGLAAFALLFSVRGVLHPGAGSTGHFLVQVSYPIVLAIAEFGALLASAGPRRGLALLSWRRWAVLATAVLPITALAPTLSIYWVSQPIYLQPVTSLLIVVVIAAILIVLFVLAGWLTSPLGKRLAVLFALVASPYLLTGLVRITGQPWNASASGGIAVIEIAAACMLFAFVRSPRRASSSVSGGGPAEG